MKNILYKETQYFRSLIIIMIMITALLVGVRAFFSTEASSGSSFYIATSLLFIVIIILFYKLDIIITERNAILSFGVGLVKRKLPINQLNLETAQNVKTTLLWGIGYRFTPHGTLFNTRVGEALHIKTKNKNSEFFVVTDNTEVIKTAIKKAQGISNT